MGPMERGSNRCVDRRHPRSDAVLDSESGQLLAGASRCRNRRRHRILDRKAEDNQALSPRLRDPNGPSTWPQGASFGGLTQARLAANMALSAAATKSSIVDGISVVVAEPMLTDRP